MTQIAFVASYVHRNTGIKTQFKENDLDEIAYSRLRCMSKGTLL